MKETLVLSLFSFRGGGCSTPYSVFDRGENSRRRCNRCNNWITVQNRSKSVLQLDLRSKFLPEFFPDISSSGVFHSRVVETLCREGIKGFRAYPMEWDRLDEWIEMMTPKADSLQWPQYFRVEFYGSVERDDSEIDPDGKGFCAECRMRVPGSRLDMSRRYRKIPVPGTWDGSDFCTWMGDWEAIAPLCSRRVVDLAAKHGWTNAAFGHPTPGVQIVSPISPNWFELIEPKVRALHPDQFD